VTRRCAKYEVLLVFISLLLGLRADANLLLQPNDRLAICGDGMTADWGYSLYLEDYLLMEEPIAGLDIAQFGWMANDPADFLAKLDTGLLPYKPTVALLDFNSGDVATRTKVQTDLVEALKKAGVRTIVIGSPVCVDSFNYQNDPAKGATENQRLAALAAIDKDVAAKEGVVYADVYGATLSAMQKEKALRGENFPLGQDHDVFNMAIASSFLKALGCDGAVGTITYDYATGTAVGTPGQQIVSVKNRTVAIKSTLPAFWFPGHNIAPDATRPDPLLACIPFNQDLNRYMFVAKNLPKGQFKVYFDDQQADFSSDQLAKGIYLSDAMPGGGEHPFGDPTSSVNFGVGNQHQLENVLGTALVQGKPDPQADAKREAAFQAAKARVAPVDFKIRIRPLTVPDPQPPAPIPVIVDTDMDTDVDDAGALALLNDFMDQGECTLLACVHDTANSDLSSCATIQAINAYYGHPAIPIGQAYGAKGPATMTSVLAPAPPEGYHGIRSCGSNYTLAVHRKFDPTFPNDDKMPAGVDIYRQALASAADGSVVICSIGTMENIQDLIQSQPDSVSHLTGLDLVRKKVRELVIMSGGNAMPQDVYLLSKWPTKILWTNMVGEAGQSLLTTPENNPVRMAYDLFGVLHSGHAACDLIGAWLAVRGTGDLWDVADGRPDNVDAVTHSSVAPHPNEQEGIEKSPDPEVTKNIDAELARPPRF
jgi:hypothetical protein